MRRFTITSVSLLSGATVVAIGVSACGSKDPPPNAAQGGYQQTAGYPTQQGGYPPPQQGYPPPQQGGYPPPQQTAPPPTATAAPTAAPAGSGGMATPGPMAFACQNDSPCGTHRCNTQFQKCAFPCQTAVDCAQGNNCMAGVCLPKAPGSP
jgi:hypothetical protein